MPSLLLVCHNPSPNMQALTDAVAAGAREAAGADLSLSVTTPLETGPDQVIACDALVVGTTENFGYMNGLLKDFFERIYYPCLEATQGKPYALYVKGGQDGHGARQSVERIVTGLRWRAAQPPLVMTGDYDSAWLAQCRELGMTMAAGLEAGLF